MIELAVWLAVILLAGILYDIGKLITLAGKSASLQQNAAETLDELLDTVEKLSRERARDHKTK